MYTSKHTFRNFVAVNLLDEDKSTYSRRNNLLQMKKRMPCEVLHNKENLYR